jgi:hypothetical protein
MKRIFKLAIDAFQAARYERARAHMVSQLDERTLRDIGLEQEANRARERTRLAMRFGGY